MFYAVIPAGGSGTRLWPLSRAGHPKFLHALTGTPLSLLQATYGRLEGLAAPECTYVVTGVAHAAAVARQLPGLPEGNILVEPTPRDSCAAIGLAAAVIARRDPSAVMGAFAADQLVRDVPAFQDTLHRAIQGAEDGLLMTIGITPTHPETGYGYLHVGEPTGTGDVCKVAEFAEKPQLDVAQRYVDSGEYLWNAGMFVWRVDVFLDELARQQPELHEGLRRIAEAWDTHDREEILAQLWPGLTKISVDFGVMEGAGAAGLVGTVPGNFGWNDVGDFHTLGELLETDTQGNVVVELAGLIDDPSYASKPTVLMQDAERVVVVPRSGRLVAAVGVSDLIIVDTPDALLICPRSRAQDVKKLVDSLKERGSSELL
ncbi:mannose-1-phosphate guanylyltransferase [Dactylosporangium matsuzakiense]|uniref:Mannose-1-phosphate guanyltransferase n=1 Tax=Dactylosporangium matsuzakiense TaxID=53360 RepID=A0A9W6KMS8_9ACTN|nr:sugar phosphate nucleotidyltransferase [Dactylosporangium matsuzakiense]UWZ44145.1 mannose-1-phosphate guanylyltransferase [Dactylosporangium matsuzakiense]GLL03424.1 mannose-1-phosphate guanyltransferase [Dactylosporangium matsuzakiense]